MTLSICILSYNTKGLTLKCLDSLISLYKKEIDRDLFEIIVVDNASTDGSVLHIKKNFPKVVLFENKENYGFSKGQNIAAKIARGTYLFFLNSDTQVIDNNLLGMVSYFESHKKVGVLGAKLCNPNGSVQLSAGKFYTLFNCIIMLFAGERIGFLRSSPKKISEVDWVMGAAFMIKKKLFDALGGFDEYFFMYVEDMEFCYRIKKAGYEVLVTPHVRVTHLGQGSSSKTFAIVNIFKGLLYFYKKHKRI